MAIIADHNLFHLKSKKCSYAMHVLEDGRLCHLYYGEAMEHDDISSALLHTGGTGYSIDGQQSPSVVPTEYGCLGTGDLREPCIMARNHLGQNCVDLRLKHWEICKGKPMPDGLPATFGEECQTLILDCQDELLGLTVKLYYTVFDHYSVIARRVTCENTGNEQIILDRALSACLELPQGEFDLMTFDGAWARERKPWRGALRPGVQSVRSRSGFSSHTHNPLLIVCDHDAGETHGRWYGMNFVYSGGFYGAVERSTMETVRMVMGIDPDTCRFTLKPGETIELPEVVLAYSGHGAEELTHTFHDFYRNHLIRKSPMEQRPVLINNWEATYFDFDEDKLVDIVDVASSIGIDLFVLDDGWFGERNSDTTSLGDWVVNRKKLPSGLDGLCKIIQDKGLAMGLWFEPECISEESRLYKEHPDWCVHIAGRTRTRSRNQLLADITRPEVRRAIMDQICDILSNAPIQYVKWDMNRPMTEPGGMGDTQQDRFSYDYIKATYAMMQELHDKFPHILLEGCSAGGARFDPGMLYYCPQFWASDNTDADARLTIQLGTAFAYPLSTIGSHVSAVPNHQTGRSVSMETRFAVAMAGTFGYELDPTKLSDCEKEEVSQQIIRFHQCEDVFVKGDYYRILTTEHEDFCFGSVSKDQKEAVFVYVQRYRTTNTLPKRIRLRGLLPNQMYRDQKTGEWYRGNLLHQVGYPLGVLEHDWQAVVIHLKG